jgi:outer membrane protein assembly factor BamA
VKRVGWRTQAHSLRISCLATFALHEGDVVNYKRIRDAIERIKVMYVQLGFKKFSYIPVLNINPLGKTYDLTIDLKPGERMQ